MKNTEAGARRVVVDVLAEHVRVVGAAGLVLAGPDGPERDLLRRWFVGARCTVVEPEPAWVGEVGAALARGQPGDGAAGRHALDAAAAVLAEREDLIVATCETRTLLVLDGGSPRVVPLGDVTASTVRAWTGDVTLPAVLRARPASLLEPLDDALSAFLERGRPLATALADLPADLVHEVEKGLRGRGVPAARPSFVPKLSRWTPGHDLAP